MRAALRRPHSRYFDECLSDETQCGRIQFCREFLLPELVSRRGNSGDRPNDSPLPTVAEKGTSRQADGMCGSQLVFKCRCGGLFLLKPYLFPDQTREETPVRRPPCD